MTTRPTVSIEWGTGSIPAGPTYTLTQQQNGYAVGQQPTAQGDNGWQNGVWQWQQYFDARITTLLSFPVSKWSLQTASTAGSTANWDGICWSPDLGLFCAVGGAGTTAQCVMTSPDGATWTGQTAAVAGSTAEWKSICWSSSLSLFCAIGEGGTVSQCIMTSPDGVTWTARTAPVAGSTAEWEAVCWSSEFGLFCAVGAGATYLCLMTSPDGVTWISRNAPMASGKWFSMAYSPYLLNFVAVSAMNPIASSVMTSR